MAARYSGVCPYDVFVSSAAPFSTEVLTEARSPLRAAASNSSLTSAANKAVAAKISKNIRCIAVADVLSILIRFPKYVPAVNAQEVTVSDIGPPAGRRMPQQLLYRGPPDLAGPATQGAGVIHDPVSRGLEAAAAQINHCV